MNFLGRDIIYEVSLYCGYKRLRNLFFAFPEKTIISRLTKLHIERLLINQTLSMVDHNRDHDKFFEEIISSDGEFQETKSFNLRKFYSLLVKKSITTRCGTVRFISYYYFENIYNNPYIVSEIYANEVIRQIEKKKLDPDPRELVIILYSYPGLIDKVKSIIPERFINRICRLTLLNYRSSFDELRARLSK